MAVMGRQLTGISEKLRAICKGMKNAEVAERVGVSQQMVSSYLTGKSTPGPNVLLSFARMAEVPLEWLADDELSAEPKRPGEMLTDEQLMAEVARRYERESFRLYDLLNATDEIDWAKVAEQLEAHGAQDPLPPDVEAALDVADAMMYLAPATIGRFNAATVAVGRHIDKPPEMLDDDTLRERTDKAWQAAYSPEVGLEVMRRRMVRAAGKLADDPVAKVRDALERWRKATGKKGKAKR